MLVLLNHVGHIVHMQLPHLLYPASFSLDMSGLIAIAEDFFNSLMPVFIWPLGITLAVSLIVLVVATVKGVFKAKA